SAKVYSTYFGGGAIDQASAIAVDSSGNTYITGKTTSSNLPTTTGAFQSALSGSSDAFVTVLNPSGSGLVYSTFLGGSGTATEEGLAIAVDAAGNAYVTGDTAATNFPTTAGAYRTTSAGGVDAFVTKLNPTGTGLVYSSFLGGSGTDIGRGIVVD